MNFELSHLSKHILFWLLYLLLWSVHDLNYNSDVIENLVTNAVPFLFYAILVYVNLYILIPRFLLKRKIATYILSLMLVIVFATLVTSQFLSFYFNGIKTGTSDFFLSLSGMVAILTEVIITLGLSMTLFLLDEWFKKEELIRDIERQKLDADMKLSRNNEMNPHFLLNSKNNIYTIVEKSAFNEVSDGHIFIKSDGMVIKVFINEITYVETASDYVYINTTKRDRYLTLVSLKQMAKKLPEEKFIRVHRYYLIGIDHVKKLEGNLIHLGKTKIKISRALKNQVYENIIGNKLVERSSEL